MPMREEPSPAQQLEQFLNYLDQLAAEHKFASDMVHQEDKRVPDPKEWKGSAEKGRHRIITGRVTGKYRHLVTLDCGTSVTYVQIIQYRRKKGAKKYID